MTEPAPVVSAPGPRPSGRIVRAFLNYGLGSYLPQVIGFLLVPLYTHYISPAEMGVLDIALTAQLLLVTVMRLGMSGSVTRYYFELKDGPEFRDLVTTVAAAMLGMSALGLVLGLVLGPYVLARWLPQVPFHPYMDISLATAFFQGVPDLQRRLFQAREQSGASAKLTVAMGLFSTLTSIVCVVGLGLGGEGVLWAGLVTAVMFALVAFVNNRADLRGGFRLAHLRQALSYGLPLVPHHTAVWAQQSVGRLVLTSVATTTAVGHLALATRLASPLAIAAGAFASAYTPVYFSWRAELVTHNALTESRRVGRAVVTLGAIAVVGASTVGCFVARHLLAESYAPSAPILAIVAAALYLHLLYMLKTVELFYSKATKWISFIFITAAGINLVAVLLFARQGGAFAAACAQLVGGVVSVAVVGWMAGKTFASPIDGRGWLLAATAVGSAFVLPRITEGTTLGLDALLSTVLFAMVGGILLELGGARADLVAYLRHRRTRSASRKVVASATDGAET